MHDRYFSHVWQRYLERNFVHTHQTVLKGKQIAFLVSGPLSQNLNAREILQGYSETMGANLVSIITDEGEDSKALDLIIENLALEMSEANKNSIVRPHTFLGDGGMKIFRDDIAGGLRFVFQEDHKYYKKHGIYDFPHKKRLQRLGITIAVMFSKIPFLRKKIRDRLTADMLRPYEKPLQKAEAVIIHEKSDNIQEDELNKSA